MTVFNFKLFELYEHINSYSVKARTLEEAVSKAIGGEECVVEDDWHNGCICAVGGEDKNGKKIEHQDFINYRFILSRRSPKEVYAKRRKSYMARVSQAHKEIYGDNAPFRKPKYRVASDIRENK